MSAELVLRRLAVTGAEAAATAMASLCGEPATAGVARVVAPGDAAAAGFPGPAVVIAVVLEGEPDGGHVLLVPEPAARRAAEAIVGERSWASEATELGELERSALAELGTSVASAAAGRAAELLGRLPDHAAPEVELVADPSGVVSAQLAGHATATSLTFGEDACLLIQLFPEAAVARAIERMERREALARPAAPEPAVVPHDAEVGAALGDVPVRVWAELGRASVPLGAAARLDGGAIVALDDDVDDPVTLYAGGSPFAVGSLLRGADGAWAVRIDRLLARAEPIGG